MRAFVLLPEALVVGSALAVLGAGLRPRRERWQRYVPWAVIAPLAVALGLELWLGARVGTTFDGGFVSDRFALFAKAALLIALVIVVAVADWEGERGGASLAAVLLAGFGGMVAASAGSLVVLWAGVELAALAAVAALAIHDRDLALRQLLATGTAGALMAIGFGLVYATVGLSTLHGIRLAMAAETANLPLAIAILLALAGFGLRLVLPPFAFAGLLAWRSAAPLGTSLVAGVGAAAAGVGLVRFLGSVAPVAPAWAPYLTALGALALTVGGLAALGAGAPRERVAYLGMVQLGWIAVGLATHDRLGTGGALFLLGCYAVAATAAPVLIGAAEGPGWTSLAGLGSRQPARAAGLALASLSLAGVPPLVAFFGEFMVAAEVAHEGLWWLLALGLGSSVLATVAAARILRALYLEDPADERRRGQARRAAVDAAQSPVAVGGAVALTLALVAGTVFANPISGLAIQGAEALGLR